MASANGTAAARPPLTSLLTDRSRVLFIPNLPLDISEKALRVWLNTPRQRQRHPTCLWIRTSQSKQRIAFVQFRSKLYAHLAKEEFNRTYLGEHLIYLRRCRSGGHGSHSDALVAERPFSTSNAVSNPHLSSAIPSTLALDSTPKTEAPEEDNSGDEISDDGSDVLARAMPAQPDGVEEDTDNDDGGGEDVSSDERRRMVRHQDAVDVDVSDKDSDRDMSDGGKDIPFGATASSIVVMEEAEEVECSMTSEDEERRGAHGENAEEDNVSDRDFDSDVMEIDSKEFQMAFRAPSRRNDGQEKPQLPSGITYAASEDASSSDEKRAVQHRRPNVRKALSGPRPRTRESEEPAGRSLSLPRHEPSILHLRQKENMQHSVPLPHVPCNKARRLLLFPTAVACVGSTGAIEFIDRVKRVRHSNAGIPPMGPKGSKTRGTVQDACVLNDDFGVVVYTDGKYQASLIDMRNPDDPDRIDLEDRPHATIGKATKFGATAVCSATSWTPNGPLRFASGGCGSADKTVRLWTITTEQHSSRLQATIVRLPPQHTAAVHALGHMTSKEYILSAGPDNHLIVTDVRAERVVHANIVEETRNEVSQFHVATPSSSGHELVLCEMKRGKGILLFDIRTRVKPVGRLGPDPKTISTEASLAKDTRTRYTRGCFVGNWFVRGKEVLDIRNTKQMITRASDEAVHSLCDPVESTILQYACQDACPLVTYFDYRAVPG